MVSVSDGIGGAIMSAVSGESGEVSGGSGACDASGGMSCNEARSLDGGAVVCMKKSGTLCRILHLMVIPDGVVMSQPLCLSCDCRMSLS